MSQPPFFEQQTWDWTVNHWMACLTRKIAVIFYDFSLWYSFFFYHQPRNRSEQRPSMSGWWFGTSICFSHILGMSSSQLTNCFFSEGWPNHQPEHVSYRCCRVADPLALILLRHLSWLTSRSRGWADTGMSREAHPPGAWGTCREGK